jgi:hypothetical protein
MGQLHSIAVQPRLAKSLSPNTLNVSAALSRIFSTALAPNLAVAVQVAFERHILKPGFHLIGARVETRRLSAMGSYGSGGVTVHRPTSPACDTPPASSGGTFGGS